MPLRLLLAFLLWSPVIAGATTAPAARPALEVLAEALGGAEAVRAGRTFAYRLTRTAANGVVGRDEDYRLDLDTGQVWRRDRRSGEETWWDGTAGWRRPAAGAAPQRDDETGRRLQAHGAYNFLRLLRDPATRAEWRGPHRLRLHPAGVEAFEVELDPRDGRIVANHFDDGSFSEETDYAPLGALVWPMAFRVPGPEGASVGRFSEVRLLDEPALP